jgi:hypothetical protein
MDEIVDINTLFGPMPFASADLTVDALLALMQKHGVGKACVLSTLGVLLDATGGNGATRAAVAEHSTLLPVATFNPIAFFGDSAPLQNLRADGFCMVRFFPHEQNWPVAFAPFSSLLEALKPTRMPVMIGVRSVGEITALQEILGSYSAPVVLSGVDYALLAEAIAALKRFEHWHLEISHLRACLSHRQRPADAALCRSVRSGTPSDSRRQCTPDPIPGRIARSIVFKTVFRESLSWQFSIFMLRWRDMSCPESIRTRARSCRVCRRGGSNERFLSRRGPRRPILSQATVFCV